MSNATKCDRCGGFYEYGGMTVGEEYDLCDGCIADFEAWMHGEMSHDTEHEAAQRIQTLEREIATLKEHRAANMEKLHGLTDECSDLRKYRDEWNGLAEKYRADSIAAQEETERYRAKLGDVLDALHEAERAAR